MSDQNRALAVQRTVTLLLLLIFLTALIGLSVAGIADPSAVLIPAILSALVGSLGLVVLLSAYAPSAAGRAVRRATAARSILLIGAIAVTVLGVTLGVVLGDGSMALLGVGVAVGPALAGVMASTARSQVAKVLP